MKKYHDVKNIQFTAKTLKINIDGKQYEFDLHTISERLAKASERERERYNISPSGYGIHWPLMDEDLSIDGLIGVKHSPETKEEISQS